MTDTLTTTPSQTERRWAKQADLPLQPAGVPIPSYSPCCQRPVLACGGYLYCYGCHRALADFSRPDRRAAMAGELRWVFLRCFVHLVFRNRRIAYVRDMPDFRPSPTGRGYVRVGPTQWVWHIPGDVVPQAFGITEPMWELPGWPEGGFTEKRAAFRSLRAWVGERLPGVKIPVAPAALSEGSPRV